MRIVTISHASKDAVIANHLGAMISRSSLKQVEAWYSSDRSERGGLQPGDRWLEVLREKLSISAAVVTLLTPNSVQRPWIYFESGFGAARAELEVIPVAVGIGLNEIPLPLATYQVYQLNDYDSAISFPGKLFHKLDIAFDEEMASVVVKPLISRLVRPPRDINSVLGDASWDTVNTGRLITYLDYRFLELSGALGNKASELSVEYSVPVDLPASGERRRELLKLDQRVKLHNVMGNIFYMLGGAVPPYSYLERWILRERNTGEWLVVREVQFRIPAHLVFWPGSEWEVLLLDTPYVASDSSVRIVRRRKEEGETYNPVAAQDG